MSRHLAKTSQHLEDDDVKIWSKGDGDDDDDVKIWDKTQAGLKNLIMPQSREQQNENEDVDEDEDRPRSKRVQSREVYRHDKALSGRNIAKIIVSAVLLAAALYLPTEGWVRAVSFVVPLLIVGFEELLNAVEDIIYGDVFNISLIISLAACAAMGIGRYPEAVLIMLLFKTGRLFEAFASARSRMSFEKLRDILADSANVETAEGVLTVSPDYVNVDDIIVIAPGERVPLDGTVIEGITSIDTRALTGDGEPRAVSVGCPVFSGMVNMTRTIRVRVTAPFDKSTANRLVELIENSPENKSKLEILAARFKRLYTPVMAVIAILVGIVPPIFFGEWTEWIRRAIILLIAACPGALSDSVPMSYLGGIGRASRQGILVKGSNCLEALAKADTMVFDKTGTITEGRFEVTDVFPVRMSERELLAIAATAERDSIHPIARCLREASGTIKDIDSRVLQIEEIPGRGISAFVGERHVYVGNAALLEEHGIRYAIPSRSGAAIHVAIDNNYCGHILIADKIREGAFDALEKLRVLGVKKTVMLTGDVLSVARPIATRLNFDMLRAELKPEEKISALEYLIKNRGDSSAIAFVGDGINDADVLDKADVGLAMGSLGYDAAIKAADILIMDDNIRILPKAVDIAKHSTLIARENVAAAICVKAVVLILGVTGMISVTAAASADVGILVLTILNSMRTLLIRK